LLKIALACCSPDEKHAASIFASNFNQLTDIWRFQSDDYGSSRSPNFCTIFFPIRPCAKAQHRRTNANHAWF
jgi:hypothetical protein